MIIKYLPIHISKITNVKCSYKIENTFCIGVKYIRRLNPLLVFHLNKVFKHLRPYLCVRMCFIGTAQHDLNNLVHFTTSYFCVLNSNLINILRNLPCPRCTRNIFFSRYRFLPHLLTEY